MPMAAGLTNVFVLLSDALAHGAADHGFTAINIKGLVRIVMAVPIIASASPDARLLQRRGRVTSAHDVPVRKSGAGLHCDETATPSVA